MSSYYAVSNTDIIRNGGTVTLTVDGIFHRIRSDYPVTITYDGRSRTQLGSDSETVLPNPAAPDRTISRRITTMVLTLPTGFGAGGSAEVRGRYGLCVIESSDADTLTTPIDPRLLPCHCYFVGEDTATSQEGVVRTVGGNAAFWSINGKLPSEFYVTAVSVIRADNSATNPHYGLMNGSSRVTCYRDSNSGDALQEQRLWTVAGIGAYTVTFPFLKMPMRSLLAPLAGETPAIELEFHELRTDHIQTQIQTFITGVIRW